MTRYLWPIAGGVALVGALIAIAASHGFGSKIAQSESARTQARGAGAGRRSGGRRSPATILSSPDLAAVEDVAN